MDTHWTHTRVIDTQRISSDVLRGNAVTQEIIAIEFIDNIKVTHFI